MVVSVGEAGETPERVTGSRDCVVRLTGSADTVLQTDGWKRTKGVLTGWTVSVSGLWDAGGTSRLFDLMVAGDAVAVGVSVGSDVWTGSAFVTGLSTQGEVRGRVTYDVELTGTGALDMGT